MMNHDEVASLPQSGELWDPGEADHADSHISQCSIQSSQQCSALSHPAHACMHMHPGNQHHIQGYVLKTI